MAVVVGSGLNVGVASSAGPVTPTVAYRHTSNPKLVRMRDLPAPRPRRTQFPPFLRRETGNLGAPRRQSIVTLAGRLMPAQQSASTADFPVMDLHRQETLFPTDQVTQPPDTQLAAGLTVLAEADNSTLSVWSKTGDLLAAADLNAFFAVPAGYDFSDPRILYDPESSRWFLSGLAFNSLNNDSQNYIAVSTTADPAGAWNKFVLVTGRALLRDQPMTGVNTDKVVVSWNDFSGSPSATPTFSGQETYVLQKSDLLAGAPAAMTVFGPDLMRFRIVPALTLTPGTTTEWLTYNEAPCTTGCGPGMSALGAVAITGTPAAHDVVWTESDPTFTKTNTPPGPRQPGGVVVTSEIDDRFLSAVWQGGTLWLSGNDACVPAGDSGTRSCLRLVKLNTGATPAVALDFDVGANGIDLYEPAVAMDPAGDIFVAYSKSSASIFPTAAAAVGAVGSPASLGELLVAAGQASYLHAPANRWGDYSAAAPDPADPRRIWVTAEYQASPVDAGDWGTATASLSLPRQAITQSGSSAPGSRQGINQSAPASPGPR